MVWDPDIVDKGDDCERREGKHHWYNEGDGPSGCYHCPPLSPVWPALTIAFADIFA